MNLEEYEKVHLTGLPGASQHLASATTGSPKAENPVRPGEPESTVEPVADSPQVSLLQALAEFLQHGWMRPDYLPLFRYALALRICEYEWKLDPTDWMDADVVKSAHKVIRDVQPAVDAMFPTGRPTAVYAVQMCLIARSSVLAYPFPDVLIEEIPDDEEAPL